MKLEQLPTQTYIPLHYTRVAFLLWICCTTFETFSKSSSPVIHAFHHLLHNWLMPRDTHWFHHQLNQSAIQFSSVQLLSCVRLLVTPWITAHQASLSTTNSWSSPKLMSIKSVMLSSHLILCRPLLLLPPIPPSIRVFSNESTLHMRWPKYWSFSFSISPSEEHQDWSPLEWTGWISSQSKGPSGVFSNTTVQKHQFFGTELSS